MEGTVSTCGCRTGSHRLRFHHGHENKTHAIQAAGGVAVLAHPVRYRRPPEELIPAAATLGIDGVETYYAYDNPAEWRPTPEKTERVEKLANAYALLSTCGTDSHGLTLTRRI